MELRSPPSRSFPSPLAESQGKPLSGDLERIEGERLRIHSVFEMQREKGHKGKGGHRSSCPDLYHATI